MSYCCHFHRLSRILQGVHGDTSPALGKKPKRKGANKYLPKRRQLFAASKGGGEGGRRGRCVKSIYNPCNFGINTCPRNGSHSPSLFFCLPVHISFGSSDKTKPTLPRPASFTFTPPLAPPQLSVMPRRSVRSLCYDYILVELL